MELKKCKHCGGDAISNIYGEDGNITISLDCKNTKCTESISIRCSISDLDKSMETVQKAWNEYNTIDNCETANDESYSDKKDNVNHPEHYCQGSMECWDEMELVFGKEVVKHWCLCNVWKYRKRALLKGGQEDLDKADVYMKKYQEYCRDGANFIGTIGTAFPTVTTTGSLSTIK